MTGAAGSVPRLRRGEDDRPVRGDRDGVLAVSRAGAVRGADGPAVGVVDNAVGAGREPGLDGDGETGLERESPPRAPGVGNGGALVHRAADSVAAELAVGHVAVLAGDLVDRVRDVADPVPGPRGGDAGLERLLGGAD